MNEHTNTLRILAFRLVKEADEAKAIANAPGNNGAREHWLTKATDFEDMAGTLRAIALIHSTPRQENAA